MYFRVRSIASGCEYQMKGEQGAARRQAVGGLSRAGPTVALLRMNGVT
jgi:hypothetical protein